jgi:uncharacterized protein DUF6519/parallel beta helix pectate lyase-like protein
MKGDFSRWTFDPADNYTGVLEQQGRVHLDTDRNADAQIAAYWRESIGGDVIGDRVAAVPASKPASFRVTEAQTDGTVVQVTLEPGRVWAEGLHLFAGGTAPFTRTATYLGPPLQSPQGQASTIAANVRDAVVLEAWEDSVSGFQDSVQLLEPALGGPDTTERAKAFYAFRLLRLGPNDDCATVAGRLADDFAARGKLTATPAPALVLSGDCPVEAGGGYTGFEHYLYRVEIAEPAGGQARFKWSQFNGGLVGRGTFAATGAGTGTVTVTANDQAINHCGLPQFYLEALACDATLGYWRVAFTADATLAQAGMLNLTNTQGAWPAAAPATAFFRLWNGLRLISEFPQGPNPNELKDGIRLEFDPPSPGNANYTPGDYWTFPVRAAGATLDPSFWPTNAAPHGVHYRRAPLAILTWGADRTASYDEDEIADCRRIFRPLSNQGVCCTFSVGDGTSTHGDFDSIEEALRHLPSSGGDICLLPGLHQANAVIQGRQNVRIKGCDTKTKVVPRQQNQSAPIFRIVDSTGVGLEHMDLTTMGGTAIRAEGTQPGASDGIEIVYNRILACTHAVRAENVAHVTMHHNRIRMLDKAEGEAAIFLAGDDSLIERNDITVVPAPSMPRIDIPEAEPVDPVDPCARFEIAYANRLVFTAYVNRVWSLALPPLFLLSRPFLAPGGIQLGPGSERVRILENAIRGGAGDGIALGGTPPAPEQPAAQPTAEHRVQSGNGAIIGQVQPPSGVNRGGIQLSFTNVSTGAAVSAVTAGDGGFGVQASDGSYRVAVVTAGLAIERVDSIAFGAFRLWVLTLEPVEEQPDQGFGFLYDIAIEGNRISNMGRSGIGLPPPSAAGAATGGAAVTNRAALLGSFLALLGNPVIGLSIAGNRITRCLTFPLTEAQRAEARSRGLGGISLGYCQNVAIQHNRIEDNGVSHVSPVCGIFIAYAEEAEIAHNRILNNGPLAPQAGDVQAGRRGGIVINLVTSLSILDALDGTGRADVSTRPAARIHENVVDQPAGNALFLGALGPLAITDNALSSEVSGESPFEQLVGTVFIFNLGGVQNMPTGVRKVATGDLAAGATAGGGADTSAQPTAAEVARPSATLTRPEASLRVLPAGYTQFAQNQVRTGRANASFLSQAIAVTDDLDYAGNQCYNLKPGYLLSNAMLWAVTVRASGSRFRESSSQALLSLFTLSVRLNATTFNQGDHCIIVVNADPAYPEQQPGNQVVHRTLCAGLNQIAEFLFTQRRV